RRTEDRRDAPPRHPATGQRCAWRTDRVFLSFRTGQSSVTSPARTPSATASVRFVAPSLVKIALTWNLIVRSLAASCAAISLLLFPRARSSSTPCSLVVSDTVLPSAFPRFATWRSTVEATTGCYNDPPPW